MKRTPEQRAAEVAYPNAYPDDREAVIARAALLAGVKWARENPPECPECHHKPGAL